MKRYFWETDQVMTSGAVNEREGKRGTLGNTTRVFVVDKATGAIVAHVDDHGQLLHGPFGKQRGKWARDDEELEPHIVAGDEHRYEDALCGPHRLACPELEVAGLLVCPKRTKRSRCLGLPLTARHIDRTTWVNNQGLVFVALVSETIHA